MARVKTHPGRMLRAELDTRGMTANQIALAIRVPANRITAILRGERAVTAETAVRLGRYLGTGPAFRMNLQSGYDISVVESAKGRMIEDEVPVATAVS
ncbi:MAG: HigA family addiction module antitoxin [Thiotrichales bacterium]|nr:HigA family addiction module antitoxin [Thiotrichales bacterium]